MKAGKVFIAGELFADRFNFPEGTRVLRATVTIAGELELVLEHETMPFDMDLSSGHEPPVVCPVYDGMQFLRWER